MATQPFAVTTQLSLTSMYVCARTIYGGLPQTTHRTRSTCLKLMRRSRRGHSTSRSRTQIRTGKLSRLKLKK